MEIRGLISPFNTVSPRGPIPLARAVEIFDQLADMEDLAFEHANNGCAARAHIMCARMKEIKLKPKKAWAFEDEQRLTPPPSVARNGWCYHVAPALSVRMPDGSVQDMVIDPALFEAPVSLHEWADIMNARHEKLQVTPFGAAPKGRAKDGRPYGDYAGSLNTSEGVDALAFNEMQEYQQWPQEGRRRVFPSQTCQQARQSYPQEGRTWETMPAPVLHAMSPKQPKIPA